ncbi:MAG TPA: hypothetical protein VFQ53_33960 [Kofleriaceae bacterium]|nr:hypothetical protein [Kofleriaceae bacterium]
MKSLVVSLVLAISATAHADDRITDDLPYKVPEGHVRAGLWKLQYGVHGVRGLEIGTYTLPYASWGFGVKSGNGHVKYQIHDGARFTAAAGLGVAYVDLRGIDIDAQIAIVPIQLLGAYRLSDRFTLGAGMMLTSISGEGAYNEDDRTDFRGAVAASNAQSWLSLTTKISRGWSLYFETRAISATEAIGDGDVTHMIDDRTQVDVSLTGNASIDELQGASVLLAAHWARERFRLRLGLGYGNMNVPVVNFVVPAAIPYPELDIYWVF